MNKKRKFNKSCDSYQLCNFIGNGEPCPYLAEGKCKKGHDIQEFLRLRRPDESLEGPCVVFDELGKCPYGLRCFFYRNHTDAEGNQIVRPDARTQRDVQLNVLDREISNALRKKTYDFSEAEKVYAHLQEYLKATAGDPGKSTHGAAMEVVPAAVAPSASVDQGSTAIMEAVTETTVVELESEKKDSPVAVEEPAVGPIIIDTFQERKLKKVGIWD